MSGGSMLKLIGRLCMYFRPKGIYEVGTNFGHPVYKYWNGRKFIPLTDEQRKSLPKYSAKRKVVE